MARTRNDSIKKITVGDIVQILKNNQVIDTQIVDSVGPKHNGPQEELFVWVKGHAGLTESEVRRLGTPQDMTVLIEKAKTESSHSQAQVSKLSLELKELKEKCNLMEQAISKTPRFIKEVEGVELLDFRGVIRWIKDYGSKF